MGKVRKANHSDTISDFFNSRAEITASHLLRLDLAEQTGRLEDEDQDQQ